MLSGIFKKNLYVNKLFNGKINMLYNSYVLYLITFASIINMVSYGLVGDLGTPLIFILVALITSSFSKNMIVIMSIGLAVSNIIKFGTNIRINEGMTSSKAADEEVEEVEDTTKKVKKEPVEVKSATNKSKLDPGFIKDAKEKMTQIKQIQDDFMQSMSTMNNHMKNVETLMNNL